MIRSEISQMVRERESMIPHTVPPQRVQIDRVLESAVVLSWKEVLQRRKDGIVHIEYDTAPEPSLQYVKIWVSTRRGLWDLICEYWMAQGTSRVPTRGLTFSNGYHSLQLQHILEHTLGHGDGIADPLSGDTSVSLILVHPPTIDDRQNATDCITEAYNRIGLAYPGAQGGAA